MTTKQQVALIKASLAVICLVNFIQGMTLLAVGVFIDHSWIGGGLAVLGLGVITGLALRLARRWGP